MKNVVFLASGGGGNLKFFHQAILEGRILGLKLSVIADRSCGSIGYALKHNIDNHLISYTRQNPAALRDALATINSDVIVTNWHKIIDEETVRLYAGKLLNLHYSLLPAFGGLIGIEPIRRAYEQGGKYIGPTCHLVDEGVDTGRILAQAIFTTNRPQEEAISIMFKMGCLTLLNGLQILLGEKIICDGGEPSDFYSPHLPFNEKEFDERFWSKVAQA